MRPLALCLAMSLITLAACDRPASAPPETATKAANPALGARWQYPREREVDGHRAQTVVTERRPVREVPDVVLRELRHHGIDAVRRVEQRLQHHLHVGHSWRR